MKLTTISLKILILLTVSSSFSFVAHLKIALLINSELKNSLGSVEDGISNVLWKKKLLQFDNLSFQRGIFSNKPKTIKVMPLHKKSGAHKILIIELSTLCSSFLCSSFYF